MYANPGRRSRSRSPNGARRVYRIRDGVRHYGPVPDLVEDLRYNEAGTPRLVRASRVPVHERGPQIGRANPRPENEWYGSELRGRRWFNEWLTRQQVGRLRFRRRPSVEGAPFYDRDTDAPMCGDCRKQLMFFNDHDAHGELCCLECGKILQGVSGPDPGPGWCLCLCTCTADEISTTIPGFQDQDFQLTRRGNLPDNDHRSERHERLEGDTLIVGLAENVLPGNIYHSSSERSPEDPISVEELLSLGLPLGVYEYERLRLRGHTEQEIRAAFPEVNTFNPPPGPPPRYICRSQSCRLPIPNELTSEATMGVRTKIGYNMCLRCYKPAGRDAENVHDNAFRNNFSLTDRRCVCRCECTEKSVFVNSSSEASGSNPPPFSKRAYGLKRGDLRRPLRPLSYHASLGMFHLRRHLSTFLDHCRANRGEIENIRQGGANRSRQDSQQIAAALSLLSGRTGRNVFVPAFVEWHEKNLCEPGLSPDEQLRGALIYLIKSTNKDVRTVRQEADEDELLLGDLITAWIELHDRTDRLQIYTARERYVQQAQATGQADRKEYQKWWLLELKTKRVTKDLLIELLATNDRMRERDSTQRADFFPAPHRFGEIGRPLLYIMGRDGRVAYVARRWAPWLHAPAGTDSSIILKVIHDFAQQALERAEQHFEELLLPVGDIVPHVPQMWERDDFPQPDHQHPPGWVATNAADNGANNPPAPPVRRIVYVDNLDNAPADTPDVMYMSHNPPQGPNGARRIAIDPQRGGAQGLTEQARQLFQEANRNAGHQQIVQQAQQDFQQAAQALLQAQQAQLAQPLAPQVPQPANMGDVLAGAGTAAQWQRMANVAAARGGYTGDGRGGRVAAGPGRRASRREDDDDDEDMEDIAP